MAVPNAPAFGPSFEQQVDWDLLLALMHALQSPDLQLLHPPPVTTTVLRRDGAAALWAK